MIGKVIKRDKSKPSSITRLNDYILNKNGAGKPTHKVQYSGTFNINCPQLATDEMRAVASMNRRSPDPFMHCLLSWRHTECPSEEQTKRAVEIALEELNLSGNQCVWALHNDTDNYHVHISINRIDTQTFRAVNPGNGWPKKAMERAARRVEYEQGWEIEDNAWTSYGTDRVSGEPEVEKHDRPSVPEYARDMENRTGERSAIRVVQERLNGKKFGSWEELHAGLAEMGIRYEKKGTGGILILGDTTVKASSAGKRFSLPYLEKSLGEFKPADAEIKARVSDEHVSEPLRTVAANPDWKAYNDERTSFYKEKRHAKARLDKMIAERETALKQKQKAERDAAFKGRSFKGKLALLNSMRAAFGANHNAQRQAMKEEHAAMRQEFRETYGTFPTFEGWLRERGKENDANDWQNRARQTIQFTVLPSQAEDVEKQKPAPRDIRGFIPQIGNKAVRFFSAETGQKAFVDAGSKINVFSNDDAAIVAALQLAAAKWGTVNILGGEKYKQRCLALAVEHGIEITNPELAEDKARLLAEKKKREEPKREERGANRALSRIEDFRAYHEAIGADRYRVTATQIFENGTKRGFMVNRRDGAPDGFTPLELESRMPRLASLEEREGRNIYYTPVSADKHHILIDDLSKAKLDKLLRDGFTPAAIIETSPNNYQAIITITKLGTDMDREIGNEIVARLNREYGDPKVSGEIHAHRAPGFGNRKPKHRGKGRDGGFPEVRLVSARRVECAKTAKLAAAIRIELAARTQKTERDLNGAAASLTPEERAAVPSAKVYEVHFKDIYRLMKGKADAIGKPVDMSKVDAMVCLRMRVTGHTQEDIRSSVEAMSPKLRAAVGDNGTHVWPDYAERTARYTFGVRGDIAVENTQGYHEHWRKVEKRAEPVKARPISERAARQMGLTRGLGKLRGADIDR